MTENLSSPAAEQTSPEQQAAEPTAAQRPAKPFAPVYIDDGNPDPSEIKIMRVNKDKKIPNWLFILIIVMMALVFPLLIFTSVIGGKDPSAVGQVMELARVLLA